MKCINRILSTILIIIISISFASCANKNNNLSGNIDFNDLKVTGSLDLKYAKKYTVDYLENGMDFIKVKDDCNYILMKKGEKEPKDLPDNTYILYKNPKNMYVAATSVIDLINKLGCLDSVKFVGTKRENWDLDYVKDAMDSGKLTYSGKYSAPDYETMIAGDCNMAIESTMIYHTPEVKETLENQGINVFVERSSYETDPLGRLEWIKLYGLILGKEDLAEKFFNKQIKRIENININSENSLSAAYFYITANGSVNVPKVNNYMSKIIETAGGKYIFNENNLKADDNALSSTNLQFESFYKMAKDCYILIYNSTIDSSVNSINDLCDKNELFKEFKAVKSGNVYATKSDLFQASTEIADVILDFNNIFMGNDNDLKYTVKLK